MSYPTFDTFWESLPDLAIDPYSPKLVAALPEPVQRYFNHAIAPGTPPAAMVKLRMHGEIKVGRWMPFEAEQVLDPHRGFLWQATVKSGLLRLRGSDHYYAGSGQINFKLFGLIPAVKASGPDISRSARGRCFIEAMWAPASLLPQRGVAWQAHDDQHLTARWSLHEESDEINLTLSPEGRLQEVQMQRWGNPGGQPFQLCPFGGLVEAEESFGGYTIPSQLRAGYWYGTDRFEEEGEFFRVTIDHAEFR